MGGWVIFSGDFTDLDSRLERFKKAFSVNNVPELRTEVHKFNPKCLALLWAWNKEIIPDVHVATDGSGKGLVLCGVVTGSGNAFQFEPDQGRCANAILNRWVNEKNFSIEQLNGSFSCVFSDPGSLETTLIVDRFASQSIWHCKENAGWLVGNFPSALAVCMKESPKIDPAGLWSLLHYGRHIGKHSLFEEMHCLLAGQKMVLLPGRNPNVSNWWKRKYRSEYGLSAKEWGRRIADALRASAERYKPVSPDPYLYLSGGLDSRIAAAAYGEPMKTITLCTHPNAESRMAARVARTLGLENRTLVRSPYWYLDTMDASSLVSSGTHLNHHTHFIVPTRKIAEAFPKATFFLGDLLENFNKHYFSVPKGGKVGFDPEIIEQVLFQMIPSTVKDKKRWGIHLNAEIKDKAGESFSEALKAHARFISEVSADPADCLDTFLRWGNVSTTYTFNMISCIRTLAGERNLFFDNDLNEISLTLPSHLRGSNVLHKWLLYSLNKKMLLIPDANNLMPPYFPNWMKHAAKKMRPVLGHVRRRLHYFKGKRIILNTSGSWLFLHAMYRKDPLYRDNIESKISANQSLKNNPLCSEQIWLSWNRYLSGELALHFELEALLSFIRLDLLLIKAKTKSK